MTSVSAHGADLGRKVRVDVAGLGLGGAMALGGIDRMGLFEVVAAADLRENALEAFRQRYGGHTYTRVADLCDDPAVEVVWVCTPTALHCQHVRMAAERGKHAVVEKPMSVRVDEALEMVEVCDKAGVRFSCGNSASLLPPFRAMRQLIASDRIGPVQAINVWAYNDWMFRPRRPEELPTEMGGGVPYVMAPHQIDVVRLLGGGMLRSVRAMTGDWMQVRPGVGYYVAFLEFESGAAATLLYNGYGYFNTLELVPWAGEPKGLAQTAALRKALRTGAGVNDAAEKESTRFGEQRELQYHGASATGPRRGAPQHFQPDCGLVVASCAAGDVRQGPDATLWVYDDDGRHRYRVTSSLDQREAEAYEIYHAIVAGHEPVHSGRWGLATIEVTDALLRSASTHREVDLEHQCQSWNEYAQLLDLEPVLE